MFSPDTLRDIGIRIVEIFPTVLNSVGYAVVLEVINRKKWVHNVRFVITDISTLRRILLDANSSHSQSRDGNTTSQNELRASTRAESLNNLKADHAFLKRTSELPSLCLRIYDETEWTAACVKWNQVQLSKNASKNPSVSHFPVDFRNSCRWGATSL